jgi:hypothetical protein
LTVLSRMTKPIGLTNECTLDGSRVCHPYQASILNLGKGIKGILIDEIMVDEVDQSRNDQGVQAFLDSVCKLHDHLLDKVVS